MTDIEELKARVKVLEEAVIALASGGTITIDNDGRPVGASSAHPVLQHCGALTFGVGPIFHARP